MCDVCNPRPSPPQQPQPALAAGGRAAAPRHSQPPQPPSTRGAARSTAGGALTDDGRRPHAHTELDDEMVAIDEAEAELFGAAGTRSAHMPAARSAPPSRTLPAGFQPKKRKRVSDGEHGADAARRQLRRRQTADVQTVILQLKSSRESPGGAGEPVGRAWGGDGRPPSPDPTWTLTLTQARASPWDVRGAGHTSGPPAWPQTHSGSSGHGASMVAAATGGGRAGKRVATRPASNAFGASATASHGLHATGSHAGGPIVVLSDSDDF